MKALTAIFHPAALDAGRILAASIIFYFHVGMVAAFPLTYSAEKAVEYFVILSGVTFVLFTNPKPATFADWMAYLRRRIFALLPVYLLVNLMLYCGSHFFHSALGRPYTIWEFVASSCGVSQFIGWRHLSAVMWFMPFIAQVYLLLPLLDWICRRLGPIPFISGGFLLSLCLSLLVSKWVDDPISANLVCKNWSPLFRLPEICAGVVMGRIATRDCCLGSGMLSLGMFGGFSIIAGWLRAHGWVRPFYLPFEGFLLPFLILSVSGLLLPVLSRVRQSVMRELGTASFAFFLIHAAPIMAVSKRFGNSPFVWLTYFFVCWGVALAMTRAMAQIKKNLASDNGDSPGKRSRTA